MPSISIVIPVYNVRAYIDRCVASVLEQTYSDFEVLFIDDCTMDDSMSIVRGFARNDSRIVFLKHDRNRGLAAARNTGVANAKSSYITFVDSDDFIAPNLLETMMTAADRGRFDVVETGVEAIDEHDGLLWRYEPEAKKIDDLLNHPDTILTINEWGVTQKLWRTSLFREKFKFPEGAIWEDISIVPSLFAEAKNLVKVPFVGYSYLQRSDSLSNSKSPKHVLDMFRAFEHYRKYLTGRGIFDRFSSTFARVAKIGADYQIEQIKQGRPDSEYDARSLVELCQVLLEEYLAGRVDMEHLTASQFEAITRSSTTRDGISVGNFASKLRLTIRSCSETKGG